MASVGGRVAVVTGAANAAGGTVVTSAGDLTEEAPARIQDRQWGRRNQCAVDRCHGGGKVEA